MTKFVTIYGERCSGTNYLEALLTSNYDVDVCWKYGWKHFFGFTDLSNSDDTLFIGIIRNPYDWINSLYREQHHLPKHFRNIDNFLNAEFYSRDASGNEIMSDRNIYTKERYKNIFEMRTTKFKFLTEAMPSLVKNYLLITYDDLLNTFNNTINKIKDKGLIVKSGINYPVNIEYYKKKKHIKFEKNNKINYISSDKIINRLNMQQERNLFKIKHNTESRPNPSIRPMTLIRF